MSVSKITKNYRKYFSVFGAFLLNFTVANFYTYNTMMQYISPTNNINTTSVFNNEVYVFTFGFIGMGISIYLGSILAERYGHKITALFASFFVSINVLIMSYTSKSSSWAFILTYGFFDGFGTGIVYGVTIGNACDWFPHRRGTACGILAAAFPLSSIIMTKAQSDAIKLLPKDSNVDYSYILFGCVYIILQIIGVICLNKPEKSTIEESLHLTSSSTINSNPNETTSDDIVTSVEISISPLKLLRKIDFWNLWLTYLFLTASFGLNMTLHREFGYKILHIPEENAKLFFEFSITWGLVAFAIGGIFWGCIIDRFRYKNVMLIISISMCLLFGTFYLAKYIPNSTRKQFYYYLWVILLYFIPSGLYSIFPSTCAQVYGMNNFIENYGLLCTAWTLSTAIVCVLLKCMEDSHHLLRVGFYCGSGMALFSSLIIFVFKSDKSKRLNPSIATILSSPNPSS